MKNLVFRLTHIRFSGHRSYYSYYFLSFIVREKKKVRMVSYLIGLKKLAIVSRITAKNVLNAIIILLNILKLT